jgi:hypothetical protein
MGTYTDIAGNIEKMNKEKGSKGGSLTYRDNNNGVLHGD